MYPEIHGAQIPGMIVCIHMPGSLTVSSTPKASVVYEMESFYGNSRRFY
jgi:hypothetical protein